MKKLFLFLCMSLFCISCGDDIQCRFMTNNLCVDSNGYYIDTEMVYQTINVVENAVNRFYPGLDLPWYIKDRDLKVKYISKEEMERDEPGASGYYTSDNRIYISYPDVWSDEIKLCQRLYYVLGHELLHFVHQEYLGWSDEDNVEHDTMLFFEWAAKNQTQLDFTVIAEYYVEIDMRDLCNSRPESIPTK